MITCALKADTNAFEISTITILAVDSFSHWCRSREFIRTVYRLYLVRGSRVAVSKPRRSPDFTPNLGLNIAAITRCFETEAFFLFLLLLLLLFVIVTIVYGFLTPKFDEKT